MLKHSLLALLYYFLLAHSLFSQPTISAIEEATAKAREYLDTSLQDSAAVWFHKSGDLLAADQQWEGAVNEYFMACNLYQFVRQIDTMIALIYRTQAIIEKYLGSRHPMLGESHVGLFSHYSATRNVPKMRYHAQKAKEIFELANTEITPTWHLHFAVMARDLEEYEDAISHCKIILQIVDTMSGYNADRLHLGALQMLVGIQGHKGNYVDRLALLKQQEILATKLHREDMLEALHNNFGSTYQALGDWERALTYYHTSPKSRTIHFNISKLYHELENLDSSKWHLDKALTDHWEDPYRIEGAQFQGSLYRHAGELYGELGQLKLAHSFFTQSVETFEILQFPVSLAITHYVWGAQLYQSKRYAEALMHIQSAIELFEANSKEQSSDLASSYGVLGQIEEAKHNWDAAILAYQKGLHLMAGQTEKDISEIPDVSEVYNPNIYLDLLNLMINCRIKRSSIEKQDLLLGLEAAQLAMEVVRFQRRNIKTTSSKESWSAKAVDICELGIEISFLLYQSEQNHIYVEQAFTFAEQSKSILLQESLQRSYATQYSGLPDSLLHQERMLSGNMAYYRQAYQKQQLHPINDSIGFTYAKQKAEQFTESYHQFEEYVEQHYPKYHELTYQQDVISLKDFQRNLQKSKSGFLEYFWGRETSYVIGVSPSNIHFHRLDSSATHQADLIQTLETFHQSTSKTDQDQPEKLYHLYQWLIQPILHNLDKINGLIIVPDGPIAYLPFDMLRSEPSQEHQAYLLEMYPISYANSATLLYRKHSLPSSSISFIGYGASYSGSLALPYSEQEVLDLQSLMDGQAYVGPQATKKGFMETGPSAQILHFAMHGFLDPQNPLQSHLLFQTDSTETGDRKLYASEIYNMTFSAKLAVLSACHTGYGPIARGEGIRSLARAFQYAGCPSVVMSLWEANGVVAKDLMPLFYQYLKDGLPKDVALQRAKLAYLADAPAHLRDPRFWANFVLVGDGGSLEGENGIWWGWWVLVVVVLLGLGWLLRTKT